MNYLLYGEENFLIEKELEKIIKKEKIDNIGINRYDLEIDNIKDVIDDCKTISLFDPKKIIIVDNCTYFNRAKNSEDDINLLLDYLTNYNPDTILIIINHSPSIDNTKKITKKIKDIGKVVELNETNPKIIVKKLFDDYKIKDTDIDLFINRVGNDISILSQEVNKIKLYKFEEKEITKDDILNCTVLNIDMDIFKFIDNIINKNKEAALTTYYEMLKNNEEPIKIIALLASKFRLMYQATTLNRKGMNDNEISKLLGVHAYPVKLAIKAGMRYPEKILLSFLKQLADLDKNIKTGKINPELGLELFIIKV